mmetsp:Transcript_11918/g.28255  ORF Transcript_11918/g.28255 Transcript_11918/m.28255 type:complete len:667 (+) Transcript_11918:80-2080(+)
MNPEQPNTKGYEGTQEGCLKNETDKIDKETLVNDAVVEVDKEEQERIKEQEIIKKAVAFWNNPVLRDVSASEKRSYLHEKQGLTNAQIYKVWEELVSKPCTEFDNNVNGSFYSNISARNNGFDHNHQYSQQTPHFPTSPKPTEPPFAKSPSMNDYDFKSHMMSGQYDPLANENHVKMEELDGSISFARGLSLLGAGGLLGVAGAAAVRWLNGGPFELLPPPSTSAKIDSLTNTSSSRSANPPNTQDIQGYVRSSRKQTCKYENESDGIERLDNKISQVYSDHDSNTRFDDEDEYNEVDHFSENDGFDLESCLLEKMEALLSSMEKNSSFQERLILKLSKTPTITDDSMNLLKHNTKCDYNIPDSKKNSSDRSCNDVFLSEQLKEVKDDLSTLWESIMKNNVSTSNVNEMATEENRQQKWSEILAKFDDCIQRIGRSADSSVESNVADSKSISTSETSVSEGQGRLDMQSSSISHSTVAADTIKENHINAPAKTTTLILLSLKDCILKIVQKNSTVIMKSGSQLLYLYLTNLSGKSNNRRYRKIFTSNESFQKVENMNGGKDLLVAVGFVERHDKGILEWVPTGSTEEEISALVLVKEAAAALGILKKPEGLTSSQLIDTALSKFSSPSSSFSGSHQSPLPPNEADHNGTIDDNNNIHQNRHGLGAT